MIRLDWNLEQISDYCSKEQEPQISHEWIYQYIYRDKRGGQIPNTTSIDERSQVVEDRSKLGDWEADTIISKGEKGAIVTLVDRKGRYLRIGLVNQRTKEAVKRIIISLLAGFPVHTIICDNGKEFADHESIAKALGARIYFAHPYSSWERGTNENTNGLIRQYIGKSRHFVH